MTTAQMISAVRARGYGSDTDAELLILLNTGGRDLYADHNFDFMAASTDISFAAGVEDSSAIVGFKALRSILLRDASYDIPGFQLLQAEDFEELRGARSSIPTTERGVPQYAMVSGTGVVSLYPVPNATYSVRVHYFEKWNDLTTGQDPLTVNRLPELYHDILVSRAITEIALRDRDWAMADRYTQITDRRTLALKQAHQFRIRTSEMDTSFWRGYDATAEADNVIL